MPHPEPLAPVSRSIEVSDRQRTLAFYRDVLGFDIKSDEEAVSGPARILFVDSGPQQREPSILFFESGDVAALHETIRSRGGAVSEIEKVNGIKMRMFEIRDPDGHILWFGQSYDRPDHVWADPMFEKALPELAIEDVPAAVAHYRDILGFRINYQQDDLGVMDRENVTLLLIQKTNQAKGTSSASFYIRDADALYAEMNSRGAHVQGEPVSHPWGLREFRVLDNEGNTLKFCQTFE